MKEKYVYYDYLTIYDDKVFTQSRVNKWKEHIVNSYEDIYTGLKAKLDYESPISFNLSISLLDEVIVDAVIGMRKIVDSENNFVENPNSFKVAAYLSYWWLRHKPVYIHYPIGFRLEKVAAKRIDGTDDATYKEQCEELAWQLKHVNELVAVQMVATYIFDFDKKICGPLICAGVKQRDSYFCFNSFDEMRDVILAKLTYYFAYRALAPKVIEHILEAYTFHPAWGLTGPHWIEEPSNEEI